MPIAHILYAAGLSFLLAVGLSLLAFGGLDYLIRSSRVAGGLEAAAGATIVLFVAVFHVEGLTEGIPRQLFAGSVVSTAYVLGPAVVGVITTDYLLGRILPLVDAALPGADAAPRGSAESPRAATTTTRRAVLGVTLGALAASLVGGMTFLRDALGSPVPEGGELPAFELQGVYEAPYLPTALDFTDDGVGYMVTIEGRVFRFEPPAPDAESIGFDQVAGGLRYPQGIEVVDDTLYTVDNGSAAGGKYGTDEGYRVLQNSDGEVVAFDVEPDGSLTNRRTVLSGFPVVNGDHALHQIETGPDGRLYLSVGHLGGEKYPEMFEDGSYAPSEEDHPNHQYLGTVVSFEPDGSDVEIVASGLRNVYDLTFDRHGNLFGANNDGMSIRSKVWESLLHITEGAYFGYPEYGTFDASPPDVEVADPLWVLDGVQSTGVETTGDIADRDGVVVGLAGKAVFVPLERGEAGVYVPEFLRPEPTLAEFDGAPIIVESGPESSLWIGSSGREDRLSVYR